MRVPGVGEPRRVIAAAVAALEREGLLIGSVSPTILSAPLGPSRRRYANAAVLVSGHIEPPALLALLQSTEQVFGRRRRGQRWRARSLDLDIVLWSGGMWDSRALTIPHPQFWTRGFVLRPATAIAANWRDPLTHLTIAQLRARLDRPRPAP